MCWGGGRREESVRQTKRDIREWSIKICRGEGRGEKITCASRNTHQSMIGCPSLPRRPSEGRGKNNNKQQCRVVPGASSCKSVSIRRQSLVDVLAVGILAVGILAVGKLIIMPFHAHSM